MKINQFKWGATLAALLLATGLQRSGAADPQLIEFDYQGYLTESKLTPDGLYSFEIQLFDAEKNGSLLAVAKPEQASVMQGFFWLHVSMPIHPCISPNNSCWLQVTIHPRQANVPDTFSIVLPRQQITGWKDPVVHPQ